MYVQKYVIPAANIVIFPQDNMVRFDKLFKYENFTYENTGYKILLNKWIKSVG